MARTKVSFLKNVTMKCFTAQTKLPLHVEVQNSKRSGLQHSCTLYSECIYKNLFSSINLEIERNDETFRRKIQNSIQNFVGNFFEVEVLFSNIIDYVVLKI